MSCRYDAPQQALRRLISGNRLYTEGRQNPADLSRARREETARNGQQPYAVVLTCSDSRVPPEHLFSAGLGDLFVVRTAGNVVGDFELGSIEYGTGHLGAPLVAVLGHSGCGAVAAALHGPGKGHIEAVAREIRLGLDGAEEEEEAVCRNIRHSKRRILESPAIQELLRAGQIAVVCARYDLATGRVDFLES